MLLRLLLLLTLVPIAELFVMIEVHRLIAARFGTGVGLLTTLGAILLTGLAGAALARTQGIRTLQKIQQSLAEGRLPDQALLEGALIVAGGALLLMPGYLTDLLGLTLLIPGTRTLWRAFLVRWFQARLRDGTIRMQGSLRASAPPSARRARSSTEGPQPGDVIIDVTPEEPTA
ncbi:MAG TPA: FxsA family protein [Isosphaeraceae bacterium]|nr:FxsA family protein [Isosphaeraceae bacterium]